MAKIYVAGKEIKRAKSVISKLRAAGHTITFDWATDYSDKNPERKARDERQGIRDADLVVYLWEDDQESARYEAGMAMGLGKPIIVSGNKDAWFFSLPEVTCVNLDDEIVEAISLP